MELVKADASVAKTDLLSSSNGRSMYGLLSCINEAFPKPGMRFEPLNFVYMYFQSFLKYFFIKLY